MNLPESREARYTMRGKPQTSWWRAKKIADETLVIRRVAPRPKPSQEENDKRREEIIGSGWKPQKPMIFAKLDMKPFQSREQFLETLETDYVEPEKKEKRISSTSPRASDMRAMERAKIMEAFDDL